MNITVGSQVLDDQENTYTLTDAIGKGGFGAVYKAVRDTDHCEVKVHFLSFWLQKRYSKNKLQAWTHWIMRY